VSKVVIDMSMSLDGFVAGPDDGSTHPLGRHGGEHIFDWYVSGDEEYQDPLFRPAPGANRDEVERMFAESGAFIFGRRTYEITNGWGGRHPVNGAPTFVLTHTPPTDYPVGPSNLTFVTDEGCAKHKIGVTQRRQCPNRRRTAPIHRRPFPNRRRFPLDHPASASSGSRAATPDSIRRRADLRPAVA
jgi:dihydrofolate reductase